MRRKAMPSLVQDNGLSLFGAKLLSKAILAYDQFDDQEQISLKFESKLNNLHSGTCN